MGYGSVLGIDLKSSWRCCGCKQLMYNLDSKGYPSQGAPIPLYVSQEYPTVCSLCYEMNVVFERADSSYWKQ